MRRRLASAAAKQRANTAHMSHTERLALVLQDQQGAMEHCIQALLDRYGIMSRTFAVGLVMEHCRIIRTDKRRDKLKLEEDCTAKLYRIPHEGIIYYPVMSWGRKSGRDVIVTYLSEDMATHHGLRGGHVPRWWIGAERRKAACADEDDGLGLD